MYRIHTIFMYIVFVIVLILSLFLGLDFHNGPSSILTFTGIEFAFLISSISTLFGKNFTRRLHLTEDKGTDIQQTQLQTLKKYYVNATYICLTTAGLAILAEMFPTFQIITSLLISFLAISVFLTYLLIKVLLNALEIESQSNT